jgi:hypothetical protein
LGQREVEGARVGPGQRRERWRHPRPKPGKKERGRREKRGDVPLLYVSWSTSEREKEKKGKGGRDKREGVMPCAYVKFGKENGMSTCVEKK